MFNKSNKIFSSYRFFKSMIENAIRHGMLSYLSGKVYQQRNFKFIDLKTS